MRGSGPASGKAVIETFGGDWRERELILGRKRLNLCLGCRRVRSIVELDVGGGAYKSASLKPGERRLREREGGAMHWHDVTARKGLCTARPNNSLYAALPQHTRLPVFILLPASAHPAPRMQQVRIHIPHTSSHLLP